MLRRIPYLQQYKDRHGRLRTYYRHGSYRVALPDDGDASFMSAYAAAQAADPNGPKKMAALKSGKPVRVYVIEDRAGMVKVGVASRTKARLQGLQTASASHLRLVAEREFPSRSDALRAERHIHHELRQFRAKGEWFSSGAERAIELLQAL